MQELLYIQHTTFSSIANFLQSTNEYHKNIKKIMNNNVTKEHNLYNEWSAGISTSKSILHMTMIGVPRTGNLTQHRRLSVYVALEVLTTVLVTMQLD